jgi:hypothetical protein
MPSGAAARFQVQQTRCGPDDWRPKSWPLTGQLWHREFTAPSVRARASVDPLVLRQISHRIEGICAIQELFIEPVSREESQRSSRRRIPSKRTYLYS